MKKTYFVLIMQFGRNGLNLPANTKFNIKGCEKGNASKFEHNDDRSLQQLQEKTDNNRPKAFDGVILCQYLSYLKSNENQELLETHFKKIIVEKD